MQLFLKMSGDMGVGMGAGCRNGGMGVGMGAWVSEWGQGSFGSSEF